MKKRKILLLFTAIVMALSISSCNFGGIDHDDIERHATYYVTQGAKYGYLMSVNGGLTPAQSQEYQDLMESEKRYTSSLTGEELEYYLEVVSNLTF